MRKLMRRIRNLAIMVAVIWFLSKTTIGQDLARAGWNFLGDVVPMPDFGRGWIVAGVFAFVLVASVVFVSLVNRLIGAFRDDEEFDEPTPRRRPVQNPQYPMMAGYGGGYQQPIIVAGPGLYGQQPQQPLQKPTRGRIRNIRPEQIQFWDGLTANRPANLYDV